MYARNRGFMKDMNRADLLKMREEQEMSNQEIADNLHLSLSVVKQTVRIVSEKSGMSRSDFATIL